MRIAPEVGVVVVGVDDLHAVGGEPFEDLALGAGDVFYRGKMAGVGALGVLGVLLAATSGAINVRLGGEALKPAAGEPAAPGLGDDADMADSGSTPGREPELAHLRSVVGLVWRSVVLWMVLLALLTLARLLG